MEKKLATSNKILIASLFSLCLLFNSAFALSVPEMNGPVNDTAKIMRQRESLELTNYLNAINNDSGTQIAVLTIPSLEGESLEGYSMRVAEKWKLGQKDKDNGVLLLIAFKERKIRIEVGYGLEGVLTDAKSGIIIRNVIAPNFQDNDFGDGIIAGTKAIAGVLGVDTSVNVKNIVSEEKQIGRASCRERV